MLGYLLGIVMGPLLLLLERLLPMITAENELNTDEEEILSVYATKKQWVKHPLMYELIIGSWINEYDFKIAINQTFYADGQEWKRETFKDDKQP